MVIHLAWICKMTSECNKYAFSTLSEVVIRDLQVVIRDLCVSLSRERERGVILKTSRRPQNVPAC
jgi:hypothetical protein